MRKKKTPQAPKRPASRSLYTSKPASWFTQSDDPRTRRAHEARLREGLKLARKFYSGLTPADGFDARRLRHIPDARITELNDLIAQANRLTSGEYHALYTLHRPRTPAQRQALILHTGLISPDERKHPQRAWPIYANTRKIKVGYVFERVPVFTGFGVRELQFETRLRAEVRRTLPGLVTATRDYLFREVLGFQPGQDSASPEGMRVGALLKTHDPWQQMLLAMSLLLPQLPDRDRKGNEAYYRLLSDRGPISTRVPKHMLFDRMQRWSEDYDQARGFAGTLIGVRFEGNEFQAVRGPQSADAKSERRRARYLKLAEERAKARGRITRTGALHPLPRKPRKKSKSKRRRKAPGKHK